MFHKAISSAIRAKARELGVKGVGVWTMFDPKKLYDETNHAGYVVVDMFMRLVEDTEDTGDNFMGIAFAKMSQMVRTLRASGVGEDLVTMFGEFAYQGGKIHIFGAEDNIMALLVAFSGGTEEQDCQIAQAGIDAALEDYNAPPEIFVVQIDPLFVEVLKDLSKL